MSKPLPSPSSKPRKDVRRSSRVLRELLERCRDAVAVSDEDGKIEFASRRVAELWGGRAERFTGMNLRELFSPRFEFLGFLERPGARRFETSIEAVGLKGNLFLVELCLERFEIDGATYLMLQMKPTLDWGPPGEQRVQERIFQALERMSAGVAHEFNNILTGILGNLNLALEAARHRSPSVPELLQGASEAGIRARGLTTELLELAHGSAGQISTCALVELVQENCFLATHDSGPRCVFEFAEDLENAHCDPAQLSRVFYELARFAREVLGPQGSLFVEAENLEMETPTGLGWQMLLPGRYVRFGIELRGSSYLAEDVARLFHPYAQPGGSHPRLSLAEVWVTMRRMGGWITAKSESRDVLRLDLFVPASEEEDAAAGARFGSRAEVVGRHHARILVMEDQEYVRLVIQRSLEVLGHRVISCAHSDEACANYRMGLEAGDRFDLVLLDLHIEGGPGGREVCESILRMDPLAVCVLMSGDAADKAMTDYGSHGFLGKLQKPFEPGQLAELVGRLVHLDDEEDRKDVIEMIEASRRIAGAEGGNILKIDFSAPVPDGVS